MKESFARRTLAIIIRALCKVLYKVKVQGVQHLPSTGGVLLVANHVSYVDALLLSYASPRPIRFLSWSGFFSRPFLGWFLKTMDCIPISSTKSKDAIRQAAECLTAGEVLCIFPEGDLTKSGELAEFKKGFELMARRAAVPVLPVALGELWGSIFSFERGRYFWKWPKRLPYPVEVSFGQPVPAGEATAEKLHNIIAGLLSRTVHQVAGENSART